MRQIVRRLATLMMAAFMVIGMAGCSEKKTMEPLEIHDLDMAELEAKMNDKETFTLLVERDNCNFCQAMNTYIEQTREEHPGDYNVYRLNTTDYQLYRENEGDMTLISSTEDGQKLLTLFPYFLYTPAIYKIEEGKPVDCGIGYDESRHTVSTWGVDSTIDWNQARQVDLWEYLAADQEDLTKLTSQSASN